MIGTEAERLAALDALYPRWEPHTIWTQFKKSAERFPTNDFLIFEDGTVTYSEAYVQICLTAKALLADGVKSGDRVALLLDNSSEFVYLSFALSMIGAIKVSINTRIGTDELIHSLSHCRVSTLFTQYIVDSTLLDQLPILKRVVLMCKNQFYHDDRMLNWKTFLCGSSAIDDKALEETAALAPDPFAVSEIMFTSGTSSYPKGVMLTADMMLRSAYGTCRTRRMEIGRRILVPIPFFHMFAYVEGLLSLLYVGGTIISSRLRFSPVHTLQIMRYYHANDFICVPTVIIAFLSKGKPHAEDYPDLHAGYWAGTCPEWVWDTAGKAFGIQDITTGYGMTECGSTSVMTRPGDSLFQVKSQHGRLKDAGVAGLPEFGGAQMSIRIVDSSTGKDVPCGVCGEIYCKGPTVTRGYYLDVKATVEAFDCQGYFKTGDLGCLDSVGNLTFLGRNRDMYKINGENVSPQLVENVLTKYPGVIAAEVVGVPHPKYGEIGVGFVDIDGNTTEEMLRKFCEEHLAPFQVPKYFFITKRTDWPMTASGKVQKFKLRQIAEKYLQNELLLEQHGKIL